MSETNNNNCSSNKRKRSDDDHDDLPKTVKMNVGGKHFEFSRSLIANDDDDNDDEDEDTFLSRLVSDTWHKDPESEIFIDRDGEVFSHVLNYLRYGEVMLPKTISMDAFMKDMDFYGIAVQEGSVRRDNSAYEMLLNIKSQLKKKEEKFKEEKMKLEELEKEIQSDRHQYQKEHEHFLLSSDIVKEYEIKAKMNHDTVKFSIQKRIRFGERQFLMSVGGKEYYNLENYEEDLLQKYLNGYGLKFTGWAGDSKLEVRML